MNVFFKNIKYDVLDMYVITGGTLVRHGMDRNGTNRTGREILSLRTLMHNSAENGFVYLSN